MAEAQMLGALVKERLAAAAEDISALFERMAAEYEEELRHSREENQRKQQLLDQLLRPRVLLDRVFTETAQNKEEPEEQSVKHEEEQPPVLVQEFNDNIVKTEEGQGEDNSPARLSWSEIKEETELSSDNDNDDNDENFEHDDNGDNYDNDDNNDSDYNYDNDNSDNWEPPLYCSASEMETQPEGDHNNQVQTSSRSKTQPPYSCKICKRSFLQQAHLDGHVRTHTGERPYKCTICMKSFMQWSDVTTHMRTHTGEKPYSCKTCTKSFTRQHSLTIHMKRHNGERPYSCTVCKKSFIQHCELKKHMRTHTGEKPYSCIVCEKSFAQQHNMLRHLKTHLRKRPYRCPDKGQSSAEN